MLENVRKYLFGLFVLLCTMMVSGVIGYFNVAIAKEWDSGTLDIIASATRAGTITPVNPENHEDEPGTPIPAEDKVLPYEDNFVQSYSYNNQYGFVMCEINEDMLAGKFVNAITHIGINDMKYTYGTVNKDKANWFEIFIPYQYINEGDNDLYFYLGWATYKVRFKTSDEFQKKLVSPSIAPQEVVSGKNEVITLNIKDTGFVDIAKWYRDFKPEYLSITEIFTMGSSKKVIDLSNYQVNLDKENNKLEIRFEDYEINQMYVYRVEINIPNYIITYKDIVLHETPPKLRGEWQTSGNNSYRITEEGDAYSSYLKAIRSVTLVTSNGTQKVLVKDVDYTAKSGMVEIFAKTFVSGEEYTILLGHRLAATAKLEMTAPAISPVIQVSLFLNDIHKGEDVTFSHENREWIDAISKITASQANVGKHEVQDWLRSDNTITIPAQNFSERDRMWTLTIEAKGFGDVDVTVFVVGDDDAPIVTGRWKTDGDFSFLIAEEDNEYSSYLRREILNVLLLDKTTGVVEKLTLNEDYKQGYTVEIYANHFLAGHKYEIRLVSRTYRTIAIDTGVPPISVIKTPVGISIADIVENQDLVIVSGDADWSEAVSSITIKDERGFYETITELNKDANSIIIPASVINSSSIQETFGSFRITITAAGYEEYVGQFLVLKESISMTQSFNNGYLMLFFEDGDFSAYDFVNSIKQIVLNGRSLTPSEYTKGVSGASIQISERLLMDGENTILVTSNQSVDLQASFQY